MNEETTPLHHYPNALGLEQTMQTSSDAWVEFFTLCREYAEVIRQRRAEKQHAEAEALSREAVQEHS